MGVADADQMRLVEAGQIPEFWVDGIGRIENLGGGTYRFVLFRAHKIPEGGSENEIVVSLLANMTALTDARDFLTDLLARATTTVLM